MIVVDTNILAYLYFDSERTTLAQAVHQKDQDWIAPALWRHEFINILAMNVRFKRLCVDDAVSIWDEALARLAGSEFYPDTGEVIRIAQANMISAYDAQFIALARQKGVVCVTEDKEMLKKCPDITLTMEAFIDGGPLVVREKKAKYTAKKKAHPVRRVKPYKAKFPLTEEFINAAKREGRA
ncbi:MAG TPA: type II toxin-antitoxin system VapC family toxin [Kiritimatiellia bacterium]|nr:type II toxin-antitoxin system VapC family toxin [Kiritimatiellia bacterium]